MTAKGRGSRQQVVAWAVGLLVVAAAGSAEASFAFRKPVTIDGTRSSAVRTSISRCW